MASFITEFKRMIKTGEINSNTLSPILNLDEAQQQAMIEQLALAPDTIAYDILFFLMNTMGPTHPLRPRLYQLTLDRAHINFKFSLILINHTNPERPGPIIHLIKHILSKETDTDLLKEIFRAAGRLGMEFFVDDLAEFVFYNDLELRKEAVTAMERIGTNKAVQRLEQIAKTDKCDLDVLDALAFLKGKRKAISIHPSRKSPKPSRSGPSQPITPKPVPIESAPPHPTTSHPATSHQDPYKNNVRLLASPHIEDRFNAFDYFSDKSPEVAEALHDNLNTQTPDLLENLLILIGRTIPRESLGDLLTLTEKKDLKNSIRFSLYTALSHYPGLESTAPIVKAVTDPAVFVSMAAIRALDTHCSDYVVAEIRKKIESGTTAGETLTTTILDTCASRLIDALMASDTFSYISSNYLESSAPLRAIDTWISILENRKQTATAKKLARIRESRSRADQPVVVVIHQSAPYTDVVSKLIHGCGFCARTFSAPQEAFEFIVSEKPAGIITDFFVRQMRITDLAVEIRELYPAEEVPLMISSLQQHLDKSHLALMLKTYGINGFWEFPPKPGRLKALTG
ncbi:HEAT repeat domain-containing protein [Desulfobacter latus]|uniref:HEAT repeat domain-containing protein n=1 Tax=Desulfobacter latus TaxID=2292 RepID=A0A850SSM9_9BACT|nr:HEAT repeat domain-containing protein [Desulfobacter latus]NWH04404.1 HEAT repeat domain-containing protein [Desulfobacter latus]